MRTNEIQLSLRDLNQRLFRRVSEEVFRSYGQVSNLGNPNEQRLKMISGVLTVPYHKHDDFIELLLRIFVESQEVDERLR